METYEGALNIPTWKLTRQRPDGSVGEFIWMPPSPERTSGLVRFTSPQKAEDFLEHHQQQDQPLQATIQADGQLGECARKWRLRLQQSEASEEFLQVVYIDPEPIKQTQQWKTQALSLTD